MSGLNDLEARTQTIPNLRLIEAEGRILQILIERAMDVPGQWVGHCLDLDIVSAGTPTRPPATPSPSDR